MSRTYSFAILLLLGLSFVGHAQDNEAIRDRIRSSYQEVLETISLSKEEPSVINLLTLTSSRKTQEGQVCRERLELYYSLEWDAVMKEEEGIDLNPLPYSDFVYFLFLVCREYSLDGVTYRDEYFYTDYGTRLGLSLHTAGQKDRILQSTEYAFLPDGSVMKEEKGGDTIQRKSSQDLSAIDFAQAKEDLRLSKIYSELLRQMGSNIR